LELDDKVQTLSYEHYYPYGGTAIIAGKDKTQVLSLQTTCFHLVCNADLQPKYLIH
jgi:hypothetical protein